MLHDVVILHAIKTVGKVHVSRALAWVSVLLQRDDTDALHTYTSHPSEIYEAQALTCTPDCSPHTLGGQLYHHLPPAVSNGLPASGHRKRR